MGTLTMGTLTMALARDRSLVLAGVMTLAGVAMLVTLGVWQLERRQWKSTLLARIEARMAGAPAPLPEEADWPRWRADTEEYRRVSATGVFLHGKETPVHGNSPREGRGNVLQGYFLLSPLQLDGGGIVLVNRGFAPTELRAIASRPAGQSQGPVTVTGLLRASQQRTAFVPADEPARDEFFTRDVAAIAAARGLMRVAPFIVDADATPNPGGWPRGGLTVISFPNNHLEYALTWFGLAGSLIGVFAVFARRRIAGGDGASPADDAGARKV